MTELRSGGQVDSVSSNTDRQITKGNFGDSYLARKLCNQHLVILRAAQCVDRGTWATPSATYAADKSA